METTYDITGLTFAEMLEVRVALDLQAERLDHLLDTCPLPEDETGMKAREYWRSRSAMCRGMMRKIDETPASQLVSGG